MHEKSIVEIKENYQDEELIDDRIYMMMPRRNIELKQGLSMIIILIEEEFHLHLEETDRFSIDLIRNDDELMENVEMNLFQSLT